MVGLLHLHLHLHLHGRPPLFAPNVCLMHHGLFKVRTHKFSAPSQDHGRPLPKTMVGLLMKMKADHEDEGGRPGRLSSVVLVSLKSGGNSNAL